MIKYTLKCADGHEAESWFQSAAAYDKLSEAGRLSCPVCGTGDVAKSLMAPKVRTSETEETQTQPMLRDPEPEVARAIEELRTKVEATSDYVGDKFTSEARAMHLGDVPERSIYGEARLDQAKELIEDGVPALPLPFIPRQKTN